MQDIGTGTATTGLPAWLGQNTFLTPSMALGINNQGQVVGNTHLLGGSGYMSAFVYDPNSSNTYSIISPLASPSAGSRYLGEPTARIFAVDINDAGQVVGRTYDDALGGNRGFIFQNGTFSDLDASVNVPFAINNSGQILGYSNVGPTVGMVLVDNGNVLSWTDLIGQNTSWSLSTGTGNMSLNNAGQIVGIGYLGSEQHAFLMTPNELNPAVDAVAPTDVQLAQMAVNSYSLSQSASVGGYGYIGSINTGARTDPVNIFAEAYLAKGQNGGLDQVVIAIRGSNPVDFLKRNGTFATGVPTQEFRKSVEDVANFIAQVRASNPKADFTLTGHSLGGAMAESLAKALGINAIAFDAPGAKGLLDGNASEIVSIARGNFQTDLYSSEKSLNNIRFYGDDVSKIGNAFNDAGANEFIQTLVPKQAEFDSIAAYKSLGGACFIYCHSMDLMVARLTESPTLLPGIIDLSDVPVLPLQGVLNVFQNAKLFDESLIPDVFSFFDPQGSSDWLEINMLDSDVDLSAIFLPAVGTQFSVWFLQDGNWMNWGSFDGYSPFDVPKSNIYRINNAQYLTEDEGNFIVGLKFANQGRFRGSIGLIENPSAVPEPETWLLLVFGFGMIGWCLRRSNAKLCRLQST